MRHDHLPAGAHPWKNFWSAGQGIDLIEDVPSVQELVSRLRAEYIQVCRTPDMSAVAAAGIGTSEPAFFPPREEGQHVH